MSPRSRFVETCLRWISSAAVSFQERYYGLSRTDVYGSYTKPDHYRWSRGSPYVLRFWSYEYQCAAKAESKRARAARWEREDALEAAALKRIEMRAAAAATTQPEASASPVTVTPKKKCAAELQKARPTTELVAWHAVAMVKLNVKGKRGTSFPLGDFPIDHFASLRRLAHRFGTLAVPKECAPLKINKAVIIRFREVGCINDLSSELLMLPYCQRRNLVNMFDILEQDFKTKISAESLDRSGIGKFIGFQDTQATEPLMVHTMIFFASS